MNKTTPKSRHYALRYLRVRDNADKIMYCPTNLMKADSLTKLECSVPQRRLTLHHVQDQDLDSRDDTYDDYFSTFTPTTVPQFSVFFGF